jgi:hypothetical protein
MHTWGHRPARYSVYVYSPVKPLLGRLAYDGRYLTVARIVAAWTWLWTTRTVAVIRDDAR